VALVFADFEPFPAGNRDPEGQSVTLSRSGVDLAPSRSSGRPRMAENAAPTALIPSEPTPPPAAATPTPEVPPLVAPALPAPVLAPVQLPVPVLPVAPPVAVVPAPILAPPPPPPVPIAALRQPVPMMVAVPVAAPPVVAPPVVVQQAVTEPKLAKIDTKTPADKNTLLAVLQLLRKYNLKV